MDFPNLENINMCVRKKEKIIKVVSTFSCKRSQKLKNRTSQKIVKEKCKTEIFCVTLFFPQNFTYLKPKRLFKILQ